MAKTINDLFFHIHYCKGRRFLEYGRFTKIFRSLPHHELILVCNGIGTYKIKNKKYLLKRGMLLYIAPDIPYSIEMDSKMPSGFLTVHFSFTGIYFNDGKWNIKQDVSRLPLHPAQELQDILPIEEQFQKLVDSWNEKLPEYEFVTRTQLQELIISVTRNLGKKEGNYSASLKVEKIIQYMHQNLNKKISLSELSELVQMSSFYMSRNFKEVTGYTIIEYFNKLKIDKSKELLLEGNKKIKEVAEELGFIDEFYFSRVFKKVEGTNPSEFSSKIVHEL